MYNKHVARIPASWAELKDNKTSTAETNGVMNGTNGINGHTNGHTNDHSNGYSDRHANGTSELPTSFLEGKAVRTVYGLVPLKYALDWPVFASYDELKGCASYMGGRIPTFEEARSIYRYVDDMKIEKAERQLSQTVPAVNG